MIDEPTDRVVLRVRSSDAQTRRFRISGFEMRPEVAESGISCSRIARTIAVISQPGARTSETIAAIDFSIM
jgi:hypothetical protein